MAKKIRHNSPPPLIEVKGSHRQIGQQIGEACRDQIQNNIDNARKLLADAYDELQLNWDGAKIQSQKYIPFAQEKYPQYVEEMYGIAEGAKVTFDEVAVVNALEAVTSDALHLDKCTSLAVNELYTADGNVLIAHNEDWLPEDEPDVYLVHATPDDEPAFLAMTYGALLPNIGFNAEGVAQCCDSVYPNDSRIGIPRVVVSRAVLAARTLEEAIRRALSPHRAAGYNHLLVHESGELYNLEVSARNFSILYGHEGYLAHTNFFLDPKMQAIEYDSDELIGTRVRYFRTLRLLRQSTNHTVKSLQAIQRDHINFPNSVCNHAEDDLDPLDRQKTINALVMDLNTRCMHFSWGNPCVNTYHTFYL